MTDKYKIELESDLGDVWRYSIIKGKETIFTGSGIECNSFLKSLLLIEQLNNIGDGSSERE